jgi:hypothetical protein
LLAAASLLVHENTLVAEINIVYDVLVNDLDTPLSTLDRLLPVNFEKAITDDRLPPK